MSFLGWLLDESEREEEEEDGDGLVGLGGGGGGDDAVRCHALVLKWRGLSSILADSSSAADQDTLRAVKQWVYLGQLPPHVTLPTVLGCALIAHQHKCRELQLCAEDDIRARFSAGGSQPQPQQQQQQQQQLQDDLAQLHQFAHEHGGILTDLCVEIEEQLSLRTPEEIAQRLLVATSDSEEEDAEVDLPALAGLKCASEDVFAKVCLAIETLAGGINLLNKACYEANCELVARLIENPIWRRQGAQAVPHAVANWDVPDAQKLACLRLLLPLSTASHASSSSMVDSFALHDAARSNCGLCVRELITNGRFKVSMVSRGGGTNSTLSSAAGNGRAAGTTPVHEAASVGATCALQVLLEFSTDQSILLPDAAFGSTALHLAAQNGQDEAVRLILQNFPQCVNAVDFAGRTALHRACGFIVDSLYFDLVQRSRPNTNQFALLSALVVQHGADGNIGTKNDATTPLMWLVGGGGKATKTTANPILIDFIPKHVEEEDVLTQCARVLIQHCDIHLQAQDGSTSLHIAVRYGFPLICRELVRSGADINGKDGTGASPLALAKRCWPPRLVGRMLLLPLPCEPVAASRLDLPQCELCQELFSTFFRRHHCRHCAACVCGECSSHFVRLAKFAPSSDTSSPTQLKKRRVCQLCYDALQLTQRQTGEERAGDDV